MAYNQAATQHNIYQIVQLQQNQRKDQSLHLNPFKIPGSQSKAHHSVTPTPNCPLCNVRGKSTQYSVTSGLPVSMKIFAFSFLPQPDPIMWDGKFIQKKKNIQARFHGTVLDVEFSVIFFNIICSGGEWRRSGSGYFCTLGSRVTQQLQVRL